MKKVIVIHHSADFDGLFCREIARKFLGDQAEYIGWDFGDAPIDLNRFEGGADNQFYVLDLPVDRVFGFDFTQPMPSWVEYMLARVVWIDHHKSSIESHPTNIPGYRIDGVAACRLAWQWFAENKGLPNKVDYVDRKVTEPYAVQLAGEYDIWDKRNPEAEIFQFGLRSVLELNWDNLLQLAPTDNFVYGYFRNLITNGRMLQRYQQGVDAGMMNRGFLVKWEGLTFLVLNTARCNPLTFAARDVPETGHDALMGFYFNGKGWNVSLYHAKHRTDLDLSAIAVKYGGGGHRGACGFRCVLGLPFFTH